MACFFHQIQRLNSLAADYLSFMSCIDPRDIPISLLPPDSSQVKQQNALGLLKAYSFITGQADDQTVSLHRLVHLATRNWLQSGGMLEQWMVNTGKRARDIFPSNEHLLKLNALELAEGVIIGAARLGVRCGWDSAWESWHFLPQNFAKMCHFMASDW